MLKALLIGTATALAFGYASVALHEHAAVSGSESMWLTAISSPVQTVATLLPGFIAGWLARDRGILAAFLAGLFGNVLYSALFGTFWNSVLVDGVSGVVSTILWLFLMGISWGLYSAAAGGTAQLLRSNKVLQADARNARA
jgi:hypothetical protein